MKKLFYITVFIAVCVSASILYIEMTAHNHVELGDNGEQADSHMSDLAFLNEIMNHEEGEAFELPPIEEATDLIHALSDLSTAMAPLLTPIIVYYVHVRKKVPEDEA